MASLILSNTVLQKRGPLAKVWLAAHYEKRLTKKEIVTTNILKSVEAIVKDGSFQRGLRLTGHLLIGIVRIYSRKAKYLLDECNEAKLSIQMAFRPGSTNVDLPADQVSALLQQITLSDTVNDIDFLVRPTDSTFLLQTTVPQNLPSDASLKLSLLPSARPQDITLAEPLLPSPEQTRHAFLENDLTMDPLLDPSWTDLNLDLGLDIDLNKPTFSLDIEQTRNVAPFMENQPLFQPDLLPSTPSKPFLRKEGEEDPFDLDVSPPKFSPEKPMSPALSDQLTFFPTDVHEPKDVDVSLKKKRKKKRSIFLDESTELPYEQLKKQTQSSANLIKPAHFVSPTFTSTTPSYTIFNDVCDTLKQWYTSSSLSSSTSVLDQEGPVSKKLKLIEPLSPVLEAVSELPHESNHSSLFPSLLEQKEPTVSMDPFSFHDEMDLFDLSLPPPPSPPPAFDILKTENGTLSSLSIEKVPSSVVQETLDPFTPTTTNGPSTFTHPTQISMSTLNFLESLTSTTSLPTTLSFTSFVPTSTSKRALAASTFYDILMMKTRQYIDVQQTDAFGEIQVTVLVL